jgi:hypothetical protein
VTGSGGEASVKLCGTELTKVTRPSPKYFEKDLFWLRAYADLRGDRLGEIHVQLGDVLSFFGTIGQLDAGRRRYSLMLLSAAQDLSVHVHRMMKYHCRAPRPVEFSQSVQPMIQTPNHSSYPSGHATEAFAVATVLHRLMTGETARMGLSHAAKPMPYRVAHRIAANRTVAGVHFPIDSRAGAFVGCHIGEAIYALATGRKIEVADMPEPVLDTAATTTPDFLLSNFTLPNTGTAEVDSQSPLGEIWSRAAREWPGAPAAV